MENIIESAGVCLGFFLQYGFEDSYPEERMGRRVIFRFSNGVHISYIDSGHFIYYRLDRPDFEVPAGQDWTWDDGAAAWKSKNVFEISDLAGIIDMFVEKWGEPELILPWQELISGQLGDFASFQDSFPDETDIVSWESFRQSLDAIENARSGNFNSQSLVSVEIMSGDALLSSQSKYLRLQGFINSLKSRGWIICDGFSDRDSALKDVESLRNSKQHSKNAPALIGYSDINNPSFMPSGDFQSISYWVQSSKGSEDLYIAKDFNLEIELAEESFTIL